MPLFRRMKAMALEASQERLEEPGNGDDEGQIALRWLEKIWQDMRKEEVAKWDTPGEKRKAARILKAGIKGKDYYHQTIACIRRDESLAFDGWRKGQEEVSFVKEFNSHAEMVRARELLVMVDFADGHITKHMVLPTAETELPELKPDRELKSKLSHREKNAAILAVRRDWMEAFAEGEGMQIGIGR